MDKSMLPEVNLISNEPLISVGLILPEDKKSSILICLQIETSKKPIKFAKIRDTFDKWLEEARYIRQKVLGRINFTS